VYSIYRTNSRYLKGSIEKLTDDQPELAALKEICEFLASNPIQANIDHRKCSIECQTKSVVSLSKYLIWVGLPEELEEDFYQIWCSKYPDADIPKISTYSYHEYSDLKEIAGILNHMSRESIIQPYLKYE
jgi:hypothetical protein